MRPVNYALRIGEGMGEERFDRHRLASSAFTSPNTIPRDTNTTGNGWRRPLLISDSLQRFPPPLYSGVQCAVCFSGKGTAVLRAATEYY